MHLGKVLLIRCWVWWSSFVWRRVFEDNLTQNRTYDYVPWQVDAICHGADFFKGVEHGPVRAAHGPAVLVLGVTKFIETSCTRPLWWKGWMFPVNSRVTWWQSVFFYYHLVQKSFVMKTKDRYIMYTSGHEQIFCFTSPCLSWWLGHLRSAEDFGHHPLWMDL